MPKINNIADIINKNRSDVLDKVSKSKIYLNIPYYDKEYAKHYGAKWNAKKKLWYIFNDNPNKATILKMYKLQDKSEDKLIDIQCNLIFYYLNKKKNNNFISILNFKKKQNMKQIASLLANKCLIININKNEIIFRYKNKIWNLSLKEFNNKKNEISSSLVFYLSSKS